MWLVSMTINKNVCITVLTLIDYMNSKANNKPE